ncbi:hypothetical protein BDE36_3751 [Arcticibacter tournemirensis]|nr:hypothetical protein BDE36_3751 [Arcticibacter tournemirensis]
MQNIVPPEASLQFFLHHNVGLFVVSHFEVYQAERGSNRDHDRGFSVLTDSSRASLRFRLSVKYFLTGIS